MPSKVDSLLEKGMADGGSKTFLGNSFHCSILFTSVFRDISVRYANLETKLGEIDRARAIYTYSSQLSDPRVSFWHFGLFRSL